MFFILKQEYNKVSLVWGTENRFPFFCKMEFIVIVQKLHLVM